ncbi:MAG: alpha-ribazole phosphatase [Saprospiraceae bacterium]|nr:alpha-ribazole phosphatase [Saprospiraceae bacterium]
MEILLIRHTTVAVPKSVCYGQSDVALADSFEGEKEAILDQIKVKWGKKMPDALFSSPLQRCQKLADFLGETWSMKPQFDDLLKEMNFGDWENKAWKDIPNSELNPWMADFVNIATPNGECYDDLHQRTHFFIEKCLEHDLKSIVIVTHAGNIRSFMSYALGLPLENSFRIHLDYGAMAALVLSTEKTYNKLLFLT